MRGKTPKLQDFLWVSANISAKRRSLQAFFAHRVRSHCVDNRLYLWQISLLMLIPIDPVTGIAVGKKIVETIPVVRSIYKSIQKRRYPRAQRNSTGIVIAIESETPEIAARIRNDFVASLEKFAQLGDARRPFQIIQLPDQHVAKIRDIHKAQDTLEKCHSKFLIHGTARNRNFAGKEHTVLDLKSVVSHGFVPQPISDALAQEMTELIPERQKIARENDLIEMEMSAVGANLASRYIVAIAALLSNEPEYCEILLLQLKDALETADTTEFTDDLKRQVILLNKKVRLSLGSLYRILANRSHMAWRKSRDASDIEAMIEYVKKISPFLPNNYATAVSWSLFHFVKGDTHRARKVLEGWKAIPDATWAFNIAFLYAFEGNLHFAKRYYAVANRRETNSKTLLEIDEFLEWALEEYKGHYEIHYCRGMLAYFFQDDPTFAKQQFEEFLANVPPGSHSDQVTDVQRYLEQIAHPNSKKKLKI